MSALVDRAGEGLHSGKSGAKLNTYRWHSHINRPLHRQFTVAAILRRFAAHPVNTYDGQCRLAFEVPGRGDQARYLLAAEHHRQGAWHLDWLHPGHQLGRDIEEGLQPGDRGVEHDRRRAFIDEVQLEPAQIIGGCGVGRLLEVGTQLGDSPEVR